MPAFAAAYALCPTLPCSPAPELVLTMRASTARPAFDSARQWSHARRETQKWPRRCTRTTASHSSSEQLTNMRSRTKPALFTTASSRPACSKSAMSEASAIAAPPAARISSTTCCAGVRSSPLPSGATPRSFTTTFAPSRAKASACARPRPRPAPLTITTRPSQIPAMSLSARGLEPLQDRHVRLPAALAHRLQAVAAASALELGEQRRHEAPAGRADRVAERDRAAVHVHLREVRAELLLPGEDDARERLVDLDEVDLVELHAGLLQRVARRRDRGRQHVDGVVGAHAQMVDARPRLEPVVLQRALGGHEQRGRAVGDLARDRRREAPTGRERLQLSHLLEARVAPRSLVVAHVAERRDLARGAALV